MEKFKYMRFESDFRTAGVSKQFRSYHNCNALFMDYSMAKQLMKMAEYSKEQVASKVAGYAHILKLIDEAQASIAEHQPHWIKEEELASSALNKLNLNPNVITFSTINLLDDSIPNLLVKLKEEFQEDLYKVASELLSIESLATEMGETLFENDILEGEEAEEDALNLINNYYANANYQENMQKAKNALSLEETQATLDKLIENIYAPVSEAFEEQTNLKSLPHPLNLIIPYVREKSEIPEH